MLLSTLRRDMLSVMSSPPLLHMLPQLLHMLPQLPPMPLTCHTPMLESTILANVKLKLTPNTSTTLEYTPTDTTDMLSQRSITESTTPLLPQSSTTMPTTEYTMESTTESTTDFTTPTLESTILASVKPKLTLNSYTIPMVLTHTPLDTPDILDTTDTLDTPPHTPTATCGTDTTSKNQDLKY